jgi:hypothetical protein
VTYFTALVLTLSVTWGEAPVLTVSPSVTWAQPEYPAGTYMCLEPTTATISADGVEMESTLSVGRLWE